MESTSKLPTLHLMTGVSNIMLFFPSQELGQINRNRHCKQVIGGHICKLTLQYRNLSTLAITKHLLWHIPTTENCSFVNFFYKIILQVKKNVLGFQTFACVHRNGLMKTFLLLLFNYTYPPFFKTTTILEGVNYHVPVNFFLTPSSIPFLHLEQKEFAP